MPTCGKFVRQPLSARRANDENIPPEHQAKNKMQKNRSMPDLNKVAADAPATPAPEAPAPFDQEAVIEALKTSLSKSHVELSSLFDGMLGDTDNLQNLLKPSGVKLSKFDHKGNSTKLQEKNKVLRDALSQQLTRRKAFAEAVVSVQEQINSHLRTKDGQLDEQKLQYEKAVDDWKLQRLTLENETMMKLDMAAQIREEMQKGFERREAELTALVEVRHNELAQVNARFEATRQELSATREELSAVRATLAVKTEQTEQSVHDKKQLEVEFESYKEHHGTTNGQQMTAIAELKMMVGTLTETVDASKMEIAAKEVHVVQQTGDIQALKQQLLEEERKRREMHNALQELKGNIRVCCRARPSGQDGDCAINMSNAANRLVLNHNGENYNFEFDRVFDAEASQEAVFKEVSELVQSALDGYKVCIFAYGQTGSGKTHTMQGSRDPNTWGVIPRSLSQIIETSHAMRAKGWRWSMQASFLEVYNESLRDLLHNEADGPPQVHTIVHDNAWGSVVTNMTIVEVSSMDEIRALMATAARQRSVGNTDMNAQSSRSHALFSLYLQGTNIELNTELCGALHLVDLAGSERLDKSNVDGCRLKETQNINRSLSSLSDVFLAKAENRSHVPFRNSKLTHLLEPCLSGHGKTLMMVNVAPEHGHAHETLCSLRFASQVSQCNTGGKPKRTVKTANEPPKAPTSRSRPQTPTLTASRPQTPTVTPRAATPPSSNQYGRPTMCF